MEVKVYNNVFDNKYDTFTYDPTRKLIEQLEEHVNTDVYKETLVECYDSETGETFYAPISEDTCDSIAIFVNDKEVDINYQPSENDVVSVVFLPASKAAQGTAWGILMGFVVAMGVGLLTIATGGTWTWLAEAFIIISGGVLGWAIGDQMDQKEKVTTGQKTGEQLPDVRGAENSSIKGNNFPFVLGKHLVTPFRIGDPTTEYTGTRGENAYIRELLCVGYAPLKLTDFKLGDFMLAYNRDHTGSDGSTISHDTLLKGLLKGYSVSPNPADSGDIVDYWKNNEIELEILQQTDKESGVDYGTIYNEAVDDQQVKGDMFYICDKQLDETAQVTYKGASFPNMFRTNGVYLTNACPRQFTVNFNFPSGLYETYSNQVSKKQTDTVYNSIPLWCCLQWRIYNSNNPTSQADGSDYDSWNTFDFGNNINYTFTTARAQADKNAHLGNDFGSHSLEDIYGNFLGKELQNFAALGGEDGISQMRVSATVTLTKEQCKQVIADTNKPKVIEIRCLRVSPNYINQTSSNSKTVGARSFSDHISCTSVVTLSFDEEKLRQNDEIVPIRPLSEADMKKFCIVAIKAKADTSGYVQSQLKSVNCIAESFSPVWDSENKTILPEGVEAKKKYFGYFNQNDERVDRSSELDVTEREVTKSDYEAARQDGINWLEEDCGSNYADIIKDIIFDTSYLHNGVTAWALSASSKKYNDNSCVSGFLLSCVGPQNGSSAIGYDRINVLSISDWADKSGALIDGSRFSADTEYNGVQYNKGDLIPLRMESNAYIYQGVKIEDLLSKVAFCGRAVWCIDDAGKIRVIMDAPADYTKGIISSQNCVTPNNIYSFEKAPAGLYISFSDENDGYETNQVYCWSDGNTMENYHGKVEGYNIEYVTNPYQIWSLGRYLLACREQQREVLTRKIGPEGNLFTLGDVILVQTDSLMLDNSAGRVQEILKENGVIYGFICDTPFEYLGVVDSDGNSTQGVTLLQTSYTGKSNTVTLPISAPRTAVINNKEYVLQKGTTSLILFGSLDGENYGVVEGNSDPSGGSTIKYKLKQEDICVFGIRDKITAPYRITKIKPEKGGGFTETLVPYDESLYNYGKSVPSFQTFSKPSPTIAPSITLSETPSTLRDLNFSQSSIISQVDNVSSDVQDISEKVDEIDAKASVWSSTATCDESTTSIAISSLSISSTDALRVDDTVIASSLMFHISAINETTVTVDFLFSCKGADGADNVINMTSATTPSGSFEGQFGIWLGQIYQWTDSAWVSQVLNVPTDSIIHYSFDEIPDIPDGDYVMKYLDGSTYQIPFRTQNGTGTTDPYTDNSNKIHYSNVNGNLNVKSDVSTSIGRGAYYKLATDDYKEKVVIFDIDVKTDNLRLRIEYRETESGTQTILQPLGATVSIGRHKVVLFVPDCYQYTVCFYANNATNFSYLEWELINFYIGDGSYVTPIIDNVNGKYNATNNGGIAVQGVSGKGAYFLDGKYANIGNYNFSDNFSISLWVKPDNNTTGLEGTLLAKGDCLYLRNGSSTTNKIFLGLYNTSTSSYINYTNVADLLATGQNHIVLIKNGTNVYIYINGVKKTITTSAPANVAQNSRDLYIGSTSNTRPQTIDDFQIYDRALTDSEVLALYQSKGNTPKYNIQPVENEITPYYAGIVASVNKYSAKIVPYKITQSNGVFTKTVMSVRDIKAGAVVICTNEVTPTSSTEQAKIMQFDGSDWNEIESTNDLYENMITLCAGDLPSLAGYYNSINVAIPNICGTYIETLTSNTAFIQKLFAEQIHLVDNGVIYGGKYLADGSIDPDATSDKGVYMDSSGEFKASNGQFSGTIKSENYEEDTSGYILEDDGDASFNGNLSVNGQQTLKGRLVISDSQWDSEKGNYIGVCSDDYSLLEGTGFNLQSNGRGSSVNDSTIDVSLLRGRQISGWKKSGESFSKLSIFADAIALGGITCCDLITYYTFTPSTSATQRTNFLTRINILEQKVGSLILRSAFTYQYYTSTGVLTPVTAYFYTILKNSTTNYQIHFYDMVGKIHSNELVVTSSGVSVRDILTGTQISGTVPLVEFAVIT